MRPHVVIHIETSVDGRITGFEPDMALFYELIPRWAEDATLAGADTMLAAPDQIPPETEEDLVPPEVREDDTRPLLVIPDSRGRVRVWHAFRRWPFWRRFVALVAESTPRDYLEYLAERHVDYVVVGEDRVDLGKALEELASRYGVTTVRVDSGGALNGALLRAGLVDEVSVLHAPVLVGGKAPTTIFTEVDGGGEHGTVKLQLEHVGKLRDDVVWTRYRVVH
jgi:2,5-diamino-6-(ribosylamino)-4(3H)-pyrimidinone 5'-phosphate reductase